jgi:hypothetical protein
MLASLIGLSMLLTLAGGIVTLGGPAEPAAAGLGSSPASGAGGCPPA